MRRPPPPHVALVRNRVVRMQVVAEVVERVAELETGVPEHLRQAPALHAVVDDLERDVMTLVASTLERR